MTGAILSLIFRAGNDEGFDLQVLVVWVVYMNTHNWILSVQRLSDLDQRKNQAIRLFGHSPTVFQSCQVEIQFLFPLMLIAHVFTKQEN